MSRGRKQADRVLLLMQALRDDGWCVVLKCLPKNLPWIIEGSRSEYDAPSRDRRIGVRKWCCEAQFLGKIYRPTRWALDEDPTGAVQKVWDQIHEKGKHERKIQS